ncbi:hypothetical protein E6P09_08220 [Haloferax mediterranei ATCC 33500]|uniref:DUF4097 domain-containing protein n=1 Tax=Haloferax mediterranei (strain ATCC 33500 / DSM 1411 / JCM 8866 / NBRC 14739 / NCIMB 2177 / R-4) TaxID=523841 RepID=I3R3E2_HALMT|nr:DUF4097 family beta strand repeat-containing protein [Haloferax mediterranei]AFK18752.1 hypothetical protein HFX_1036 [Haloferax mediterranei ATCC 33500]AHZ21880.1 hypothetical protein BM92_04030 [Haloferax mediterranei ATCC 33500]EMA03388.1 hypothetical protein C439_05300 [Haloferax mediterranei ATCC 33500]MDX5988848.1 DUF4097 family beta strand repeat-containing protein [Haloferax mediterranei ATCC 33500]QCQ75248.1 hypothetical protein E6P09_08220 [Haloferax mediterranei ATCC 33500]
MLSRTRRSFLRLGAALGIAGLAGCTAPGIEAREEETRTVSAADVESVEVLNSNGGIQIHTWDEDGIELHIVKRGFSADDFDSVQVDATGDKPLTIERVDQAEAADRVSVNLEVRVPPELPVGRATTTNGGVDIQGTTGDLETQSTNGSVEARRIDGFVALSTTNGSITAQDVGGIDTAQTTNGSVEVDVPAIRDDTTIESSNGGVDAALAQELNAELVAQTTNGSVESTGLSLSDATSSRTGLSGTLSEGGPTLDVSTSNGDIELSLL